MEYLLDLGLTDDNIGTLNATLPSAEKEQIQLFKKVVIKNYGTLKEVGVKNHVDIFINHTHMFLINPDRFAAIFNKYDRNDLIRCLEKNAAIIEKL